MKRQLQQNVSALYLPEHLRKFNKPEKKKKKVPVEEFPTAALPGMDKKNVKFDVDLQLHAIKEFAEVQVSNEPDSAAFRKKKKTRKR
jgi:hypothetical protein